MRHRHIIAYSVGPLSMQCSGLHGRHLAAVGAQVAALREAKAWCPVAAGTASTLSATP